MDDQSYNGLVVVTLIMLRSGTLVFVQTECAYLLNIEILFLPKNCTRQHVKCWIESLQTESTKDWKIYGMLKENTWCNFAGS